MKKKWLLILITLFYSLFAGEQIARLHYNGGGDWYNDPDAIPNFCNFLNNNLSANLLLQEAVVTPSSSDIFQYPFIFVTGHGDIKFDEKERKNIDFSAIWKRQEIPAYFLRELQKISKYINDYITNTPENFTNIS